MLIDVLDVLDEGKFIPVIEKALKIVSLGVVNHGKKGEVVIKLSIAPIGDSSAVNINHSVKFTEPTKKGKTYEEYANVASMFVDIDGTLTIFNRSQKDLFKPETPNNITKLGVK
jgi:hypothetical protein